MRESERLKKVLKKVEEIENRPDLSEFAKSHLAHVVHAALPDLRSQAERDRAVHRLLSENGVPNADNPIIHCYPPEILTDKQSDLVWKEIKKIRGF